VACDVFISYTRQKDDYNAVTNFRGHLEHELRGTTGRRDLNVFQDKNFLDPGAPWPEELRDNVVSARLFLILLSPGWLVSAWCGREYSIFKQSMTEDAKKAVVPVLWYGVEDLTTLEPNQQDLLTELRKYNWTDWRVLRLLNYESRESEKLNIATCNLAMGLRRHFPLNE
jgi:hypothetical protein